jgi:hypothetical protein
MGGPRIGQIWHTDAALDLKRTRMRSSSPALPRSKWAEAVERRAASKQERLEQDLNGFKTNLIKESIRIGQNELGDFFYQRGDLQVGEASMRAPCAPCTWI